MPSHPKVVIDTSTLVRILTSPFYQRNDLLQAWQMQALLPIACPATNAELMDTIPRVMRRRRLAPLSETEQRINAYLGWCHMAADPAANLWPSQCRDESDQVFLDLAVAENAGLIIADDPDILSIGTPHPVRIVSSGEAESTARRLTLTQRA